mgnify:CR=1 FL=1
MTATFTLADLADRLGAQVRGDGSVRIRGVAPLERAQAGEIAALVDRKYLRLLDRSSPSALIIAPDLAELIKQPCLVSNNAYATFARALALFHPPPAVKPGIDATARIDPTAKVSARAQIGAHVSVGARVIIDEGCVVHAGVHIADDVAIGADSVLYAGVIVYAGCVIGKRVIVHGGAVIGADGFGLAPEHGRWIKIPQVGRVVIGDDVEIGANTTIDRGTLDDTVIEEGVKLDNQIQIAHNVRIGAHTAIAACVGIAGSTRIGRHCTIGGAAGIIGHLDIADQVRISAFSLVAKSISEPGTYTSTPALLKHADWLRNSAVARNLTELERRVRALENALPDDDKHS